MSRSRRNVLISLFLSSKLPSLFDLLFTFAQHTDHLLDVGFVIKLRRYVSFGESISLIVVDDHDERSN